MRQAHLWFACDGCDEESSPASTWRQARQYAKSDGWTLGATDRCPDCTALPTEGDDE